MRTALLFLLLFLCAAADETDYCPRGTAGAEVYDAVGLFWPPTSLVGEAVSKGFGCPKDGRSTSVAQLFTPPALPWLYEHISVAFVVAPSSGSAGEITASISMRRVNADYTVGSVLASTNVAFTASSQTPTVFSWNLSTAFETYEPRVYFSVEFTQCMQNAASQYAKISATLGDEFPARLCQWVPKPSVSPGVWERIPTNIATSLAIRLCGKQGLKLVSPPDWTCGLGNYSAGNGVCDCDCGAYDPDCMDATSTIVGCDPGYVCTSNGTCIDPGWDVLTVKCSETHFDARDGCDCCAGIRDPDCEDPTQTTTCGGVPAASCTFSTGSCTAAWTCSGDLYGDGSECNCGCGAPDSDCSDLMLATNCAADTRICGANSSECWLPRAWTCDYTMYGDGNCDTTCNAIDIDCLLSSSFSSVSSSSAPPMPAPATISSSSSSSVSAKESSGENNNTQGGGDPSTESSSGIAAASGSGDGAAFPLWAIIVTAVGAFAVVAGIGTVLACVFLGRKKRGKKKQVSAEEGNTEAEGTEMRPTSSSLESKPTAAPIPPVAATAAAAAERPTKKKDKGKDKGKAKHNRAFSFRIPESKTEQVIEDAAGNPLFVSWDADGKLVVKDLGGNVLQLDVNEQNHMVAVYTGIAPPSTTRKAPDETAPQSQSPPPAYSPIAATTV